MGELSSYENQSRCYISHIDGNGQEEPLKNHLTEVSQMAGEFADAFGARELAEQIGLAHDIGKYSDAFQNHIKNNDSCKVDHSTAGAYELLQRGSWCGAYCVAGHHAGLMDGGSDTSRDDGTLSARMKKVDSPGIVVDGSQALNYSDFAAEIALQQTNSMNLNLLDGWGVEECTFSNAFATRMLFSCLVDADYLCTERFMNGGKLRKGLHYDTVETLRDRFEKYISRFYPPKNSLNELRCAVLDACKEAACQKPGVYSLTVPTGGGKTLASMRFALNHALHGDNHMQRVIYAVPYTSIIEQNAAVFKEVLGEENVLEHHSNIDFDFGEDTAEGGLKERLRLATENWDAPVIVTTNVQFFESLYAAKTSRCRKLHNIARSVIVLDEAQMIPTNQLKPCIRALTELVVNYGCSVVLCTATQPAFDGFFNELGLEVKEIAPWPEQLAIELERVTYNFVGELDDDELAERIADEHRVLCIVDNRAQARRLFEKLEGGVEGLYHLSTLMYPAHRQRVLKEIRERLAVVDAPCRVISTSLVEAGVDLDFPVVYRSYTGVDSIIQAAGRCNREGKFGHGGGSVYVFETDGSVKSPSEVENRAAVTRSVVRDDLANDFSLIGSLEAIQAYFETLFWLRKEKLDSSNAVKNLSCPFVVKGRGRFSFRPFPSFPFKTVADDFQMIEEGSVPVIIPDAAVIEEVAALESGYATRRDMRKLSRFSVNVYRDALKRLLSCGAVKPVEGAEDLFLLLDMHGYSETTGLDVGGASINNEFLAL